MLGSLQLATAGSVGQGCRLTQTNVQMSPTYKWDNIEHLIAGWIRIDKNDSICTNNGPIQAR